MAKKGKKARTPKNNANGYKMPPPIPLGEVIHYRNSKWKIGPSIGIGGFGEIYSACELKDGNPTSNDASDYPYVVKIEPMENGPLFVEMHFYNRNGDRNDIEQFMKSRNLSQLGMPNYCGSGSHKFQDEELRFLILERYGTDLWKKFDQVGRKFPAATVFQIGLQMLDVLDYVHSRSYIHADIKGANILLGIKEGTENQAYLLDFGLAYRIVDDNYKPDPKSAHEGTIEYTSTDRHIGAKTMRGDLEILAYNLLHWLVGELPWEKVLHDPKKVHKIKTDLINDVRTRITTDYPNVPDELIQFFEYIKTLEPKDVPDYTICREIFESYLTSVGKTRTSKLEFTITNNNDESVPLSLNGDNSKPTEYRESDQPDDVQEQKVTKNKKNKNKRDKDTEVITIPENDIESVQLDKKEQTVAKNKKNKKKRDENSEDTPSAADDAESEHTDDNQEQKLSKNKKNKHKKGENSEIKTSAENDVDIEQPDDKKEKKITKNKKDKSKRDKYPEVEHDGESEQTDESQEQKVTKIKKNKKNGDENFESTAPVEKDVESEQADDNHNKKLNKKNKKKKDKITEDILSAENDAESEQIDDNQEEVTKAKKNKRKRGEKIKDAPLAEEDVASEEPDEAEYEKATKKNKNKRNKKSEDKLSAENDAENDDQEQEVLKPKKNRKKREKEPNVDNEAELDFQEQPVKKKKPSAPTTPKDKKKKKTKPKEYTESDSDTAFLDTIQKKKRNRIKADTVSHLSKPKLPLKSVDNDDKTNNDTEIPRRALRSKGQKTRACYADLC